MKNVRLSSLRFGKDSDDSVKRKLIIVLALLTLIVSTVPFITSPAYADYNWSNIGNPGGGEYVDCLTSAGSIIYAATVSSSEFGKAGIHKYDGTGWSKIGDFEAYALLAVGGNVYAGSHSRVYVYNGTSWGTTGPLVIATIDSLAYDSGVLYAATFGGQYYGFPDALHALNVSSWQEVAQLPIQTSQSQTHNLAVLRSDIYAGFWAYGGFEGQGVYRYDNAGSWTYIGCPSYQHVIFSHGSNLYAGGGRSVFKYDGNSWVDIGIPDPNPSSRVYCFTAVGSDIFAGTNWSVFKYDGSSWIDTNWGDLYPDDRRILSLTNDGTNIYAGTFNGNVYRCPSTPPSYVNKNDATCGGKVPCYSSIQVAINAATTGAAIKVAQGIYNENPTLNMSKSLTLQGGWNSAFTSQTPNTTFIKAPKAPQGALTLQMLIVKP